MARRGPDSPQPELDFGTYESNRNVRWTPRYSGYEYNWARTGATTHTLLSEGQHTGLAAQVRSGEVDYALLAIGGNDFTRFDGRWVNDVPMDMVNVYEPVYNQQFPFIGSDYNSYATVEDYVSSIVGRYTAALDTASGAGAKMVLGTAADYSSEAATQYEYDDPSKRQHVTDAVAMVNDAVRELAADRGIYVVDVGGLKDMYVSPDPLVVGGVEIIKGWPWEHDPHYFYLRDGGHLGTVVQGLFANTFIEAMNRCHGTDFTPLSDQEILANAGIPDPNPGGDPTYFDVTPFVIVPEPSTLTLLTMGAVVCWRMAGGGGGVEFPL